MGEVRPDRGNITRIAAFAKQEEAGRQYIIRRRSLLQEGSERWQRMLALGRRKMADQAAPISEGGL